MRKKQLIKLHPYAYTLLIGEPVKGGFFNSIRFQCPFGSEFGKLGFRLCVKNK